MKTPRQKSCLIIAGGEFSPLPYTFLPDFVIACDRGFEYAGALGFCPDLIVGDFDSAASMPDGSVPVIRLPAIKDDTDTMSAVREALGRGFRDIRICCAFGGRFDHSLANVQTAAFLAEHGAQARLYGRDTELITLKNGSLTLPLRPCSYLSVFALTDVCSGVTLTGTKYETENASLSSHFPLGVSNEWAAEEARITVREGLLAILICTKDLQQIR